MKYSLMEPPFKIKSFDEMNGSEGQEHFEWFISEIPNRLKLLEKAINITSKNSSLKLDFTKILQKNH